LAAGTGSTFPAACFCKPTTTYREFQKNTTWAPSRSRGAPQLTKTAQKSTDGHARSLKNQARTNPAGARKRPVDGRKYSSRFAHSGRNSQESPTLLLAGYGVISNLTATTEFA